MLELTPQQKQDDINQRCDAAMKEMEPILEKFKVIFSARIQRTEQADIAIPVLMDKKYKPEKSPIQLI